MADHGKRALALIFAALFVASPALAQSTSTQANSVFRDFNTPGDAVSGIYNPPKTDIRTLFATIGERVGISAKDYGAKGDGTTDDTAAIQSAIAAVPSGGILKLSCGNYKVSGTGSEAFLITKPMSVIGEGRCVSFTNGLGASTDLFHIRPTSGAVLRGFRFSNFQISLGQSRHQFHFDSNASSTSEMGEVEVDHISSATQSGHFVYIDNPSSNGNGGTFNVNIHDNVAYAAAGTSSVELLNAGDTLRVRDNILTGPGYAVHGSQIAGAGQLVIEGNNITAYGGVVFSGGAKPVIRHNEIELVGPNAATNGYMVGLVGVDGATIADNQIQSLSGASLGENVFIGAGSSNVVIEGNRLYSSATSVVGLDFASGVAGIKVGCGNSFSGFAANLFGDLSGVTQCEQFSATYPDLNAQSDNFRVQLGAALASQEFGSGNVNGNFSTAALTGAIGIPAGAYSGASGWPDYGVQGVAINYNATKSGIGVFANTNLAVAGSSGQGINSVATNCIYASAPCNAGTGGGFNFGFMDGSELDVNVMPLTGGAAPSGNVTGLSIYHGGTIQPSGVFSAIKVAVGFPGTTPPFKVGMETGPGTAQIGISLGAVAATGVSTSQPIFLNSNDGSAAHNASLQANSDGSLQLNPGGGTIVLGSVPTSGTAIGTLCVASGNRVFVKTTAGACL